MLCPSFLFFTTSFLFCMLSPLPPPPSGLFLHFAKMKSSLSFLWHSLSPMCSVKFSLKLQLRMKKKHPSTPLLDGDYMCMYNTYVQTFGRQICNILIILFLFPSSFIHLWKRLGRHCLPLNEDAKKPNKLSSSVTLQSILWVKIER